MRRATKGVIGIAVFMAVAGAAYGQAPAGANGRALDRNLQVGSGGVIPQKPSAVDEMIRFNNAVMYGQASGGKSFQGRIGYRAPNQIDAHLGTDDSYSFRRDALSSAASGMGVRSSDAIRYQFSSVTGTRVPEFMGQSVTQLIRSGTMATSANATALRSTAEFLSARQLSPALVGRRQDEFGADFVAKASPLLGVTWTKTAESPLSAGKTNLAAPNEPGKPAVTPLTGLESAAPGVTGVLDRDLITGMPKKSDKDSTARKSQIHQNLLNEVRDGAGEKVKPIDRSAPNTPPVPASDGQKPATPPEPQTLELQLERLRASMRGEPGPKTLKEMKEQQAKRDAQKSSQPATPAAQSADAQPQPEGTEARNAAKKEQADAKKPGAKLETLSPELLQGIKKAGEKKLDGLIEAPADTTNSIQDPDAYTTLMTSGQYWMEHERYFDAEDRYTRAIAAMPGDPMARIGRINAQLGAGLYLSAAANLRSLLADNPELVAVRYGDKVFPSADRCKKAAEQLRFELDRSNSTLQRDAALLMAYLGYQRGDIQLTIDGLQAFNSRIHSDNTQDQALNLLIQASWTK